MSALYADIPDLPEQAFRRQPFKHSPATLEGKSKAPKPDPNIGLSQIQLANLATREQDWYENVVWPQLMGLQDRAQTTADEQAAIQAALQRQQMDQAGFYFDRFKNVQVPLENQIIQEAVDYNTPTKAEERVRSAQADVGMQFGLARQQLQRSLDRRGVNPGSAAAIAAMRSSGLDEARAKSLASANVRQAAEQLGWAKKLEASALARGLPGFSASSSQLAGGLGMNALNSALAPVNTFNQAAGTMGQGFANQANAWSNVGQLGIQNYNAQLQAWQTEMNNNPFNTILGAATGVATGWGLKKFGL